LLIRCDRNQIDCGRSRRIASAQMNQPAPGASSQGNVGPGASDPAMHSGTGSGGGMTTGSGTTGSGMNKNGAMKDTNSRNPSSQGNAGPGTDNNNPPRK
jgi:hypothetical protein